MIKICLIVGTRPEAIKLLPLAKKIRASNKYAVEILSTGQHREMLDQVFDIFHETADHDIAVMTKNQGLQELSSRLIIEIDKKLSTIKPHLVVVQGDTTTAFCGALVAFYKKIKVAHVEAGLRSEDIYNPFPEEMNRKLVSQLANIHFAPTEFARNNLINESINNKDIYVTGNTVIDAVHLIRDMMLKKSKDGIFIDNKKERLILVTAHRRENIGEPLEQCCDAIKRIIEKNSNIKVIFPVHYNPNVRNIVYKKLTNINRIKLIDPLPYHTFIHYMNQSYILLTDSGGLQEEGPALKKPVLIMRNETERQEGIDAGVARLVGCDKEQIVTGVEKLLKSEDEYNNMINNANPFGDGTACEKILQACDNYF